MWIARLLQPIKFILIFFFIFTFLVHAALVYLFSKNIWTHRRSIIHWMERYSRLGLKIIGIKVIGKGHNDLETNNYLVVSNHLSYLDILVFASLYPSCFITSMEIRRTPLLGQITLMAGCLFVDRQNKANLRNEIQDITQALEHGLNVTVFPEATSTNGAEVLRFRRPLYAAAVMSGRPVKPLALNYVSIDGLPTSPANRDYVCWYDKMGFGSHLWALLGRREVVAEVVFLEPISMAPELDATRLAELSHERVKSAYHAIH